MAIIRDRSLMGQDGSIPVKLLLNCIKEHMEDIERLNKLEDYYNGEHEILDREMGDDLPNNKLVCNHAEYITNMATGYFIGNPITYKDDDIEPILDNFKKIKIHTIDTELCRNISKYGRGFELVYMTSDEKPIPKSVNVDPKNIFLVCDDTIEHIPIFAVHYYPKYNLENKVSGYSVFVYTDNHIYEYLFESLAKANNIKEIDVTEHYFNSVPVIEYKNKPNAKGDYEGVITLIDAYNKLQSDRINDKEQLVDALLATTGVSFGDNIEEMSQTAKFLRKYKILELPEGGKAEWLTKILNEGEVEILKKSIKADIHEFSQVPDLTDENFAGQASGVSLKYKLFGLEQLAKTKEEYYKIGLYKRLQLYANIFNTKGYNIDIDDTEIVMKRSLPVNEVELANMVVNLDGTVSKKTRIALLPFVQDVEREIEELQEEKQDNIKIQQEAFKSYDFRQGLEDE